MLDPLRSALLTGTCHLSNQFGGVPEEIRSATTKDGGVPYGWSPRTSVTGGMAEAGFHRDEVIWQARGDRVGILSDHEVWPMPRTVLGVATPLLTGSHLAGYSHFRIYSAPALRAMPHFVHGGLHAQSTRQGPINDDGTFDPRPLRLRRTGVGPGLQRHGPGRHRHRRRPRHRP